MIRFKLSHTLPALALALAIGAPAMADEAQPTGAEQTAAEAQANTLDLTELNATNGTGAEIDNSINDSVVSSQELSATNTDNHIGGDVLSGAVSFSDAALQGFSGIGNFAINTGAQSNIQSSINITVSTVAP